MSNNYVIYYLLRPFSLPPPSTTHSYPLSLHDALPISPPRPVIWCKSSDGTAKNQTCQDQGPLTLERSKGVDEEISADRKSTRLNSSHLGISYAVFCLKKKNQNKV